SGISKDGKYTNIKGLAADNAGNVYVVESSDSRVEKISSTGSFIANIGSPGEENGQFTLPDGIAVDSAGNIYVADSGDGSGRIQKFTSTGSYINGWLSDSYEELNWIAANSAGDVYFTSPDGIQMIPAEDFTKNPMPTVTVLP